MTVHLVPPNAGASRVSVCGAVLCTAGRHAEGGNDETTGLPYGNGTTQRSNIDCPACLAASSPSEWIVQVRHRRLCPDWETRKEVADGADAVSWAKAYRADGYEPRIRRWCPACATYVRSYLGDRCSKCVGPRAEAV